MNAALARPSCSDTTLGATPTAKASVADVWCRFVEPDIRQTSFPQEWFEMLLHQVLLVDRLTTRGRKDQTSEGGVARLATGVGLTFQFPE